MSSYISSPQPQSADSNGPTHAFQAEDHLMPVSSDAAQKFHAAATAERFL